MHVYLQRRTGSGTPLPVFQIDGCQGRSGLLSVDLFGQAGNLAGGRAFVQDPSFCGFIDDGLGRIEPLIRIFRIIGRGLRHILDDISDPGFNGFVALTPLSVLDGAFQC